MCFGNVQRIPFKRFLFWGVFTILIVLNMFSAIKLLHFIDMFVSISVNISANEAT